MKRFTVIFSPVAIDDVKQAVDYSKNSKPAWVKGLPHSMPDVVLMDINLPGISGIEAVRQLKDKCPATQFIMSTVYEDDENIFESLKAGASGYLLKKTAPSRILDAITEVYNGGSPMTGGA